MLSTMKHAMKQQKQQKKSPDLIFWVARQPKLLAQNDKRFKRRLRPGYHKNNIEHRAIWDLNDNSFCSMNFMISLKSFKSPFVPFCQTNHVKIICALAPPPPLQSTLPAVNFEYKIRCKEESFPLYLSVFFFLPSSPLTRTTNKQWSESLLWGFLPLSH